KLSHQRPHRVVHFQRNILLGFFRQEVTYQGAFGRIFAGHALLRSIILTMITPANRGRSFEKVRPVPQRRRPLTHGSQVIEDPYGTPAGGDDQIVVLDRQVGDGGGRQV